MFCWHLQEGLAERLHWERVVLEQAAHYQVVPLVLINLKGCPNTTQTQQLVEGIKVCRAIVCQEQLDNMFCQSHRRFGPVRQQHNVFSELHRQLQAVSYVAMSRLQEGACSSCFLSQTALRSAQLRVWCVFTSTLLQHCVTKSWLTVL
jgi:hypothetical protein